MITGRPKKKIPDKQILTKEYLWNEYYTKNKTQRDIAEDTGLARWTVQQLFKEYDIPPRKTNNRNVSFDNDANLNNPEWLADQHIIQGKSQIQISKELGVSDVTIGKKFKKFNIQPNQCHGNFVWNIFKDSDDLINTLSIDNETMSLTEIAEKYSVSIACVSLWFKNHGIMPIIHFSSKPQKDLFQWLSQHIECYENDRISLGGKELDIFVPSKKIAIELNGLYFHSTRSISDKNVHAIKTDMCIERGIKLFQIYDIEWERKPEIVKSMLLNAIGQTQTKIMARKTTIKTIPQKDATVFYNENHMQGSTISKFHYALYYEDEIVSVMSFAQSRWNKKYSWELSRFASKINCQVLGGASKLLNHFVKSHNPDSIISYADRRISNGDLYHKLNFQFDALISPDYHYIVDKKLVRKEHFRHSRMKSKLPNYDPNLTEWQNTANHGIHRIYDCGKIRFVWINPRNLPS